MASYPGGKNKVYQTIINQMPPHRVYIEPFLGSGAILRYKRPAIASIVIDVDAAVIDSWDVAPPGTTLICGDAINWLASTAITDDTLIYLDPPYMMSSRSSHRQIYRCELEDRQHVELLDVITRLTCMVMISGYYTTLYGSRLASWRHITFEAQTRSGKTATEWLWMNYPEPLELHDYRYLGDDFREREKIKRRRERWKTRLQRMDRLERLSMLSAIAEMR
jgi:DNA adenine methylase